MVWKERQDHTFHAPTDRGGGHRNRPSRGAERRNLDGRGNKRPEAVHRVVRHAMVGGREPSGVRGYQVCGTGTRSAD